MKGAGNVTITYNGTDITSYLNTAAINAVVNQIDTTNLGSTANESEPGLPTWTVPIGGPWSKALDDVIGVDAHTPPSTLRTLAVTIGPAGSQVTWTWTNAAYPTNYQINVGAPAEGVTWSATLNGSGAPTRA